MRGPASAMRAAWLAFTFALVVAMPARAQEPDASLVERGRYLAIAGDCAACHTRPDVGKPFAGGYGIVSPLGTIFSTNITPSRTAGIGGYSEQDFARALREGRRADGSHLYPAMPYTAYARLTDQDVAALYAYFMRAVAPADEKTEETRLPFPFNIRWFMAAWNLLFLDDRRFAPDPTRSPTINRGAYLVEGLAHCGTCHTPRNALMGEQASRAFAGGSLGAWYAPNITPDPVSSIGNWSEAEIATYLKTGRLAGRAQAAGPMAEAVTHSFGHMTDADLAAMAAYLKSVPAIHDPVDQTPRDSFGTTVDLEPGLRGASEPDPGAALYSGLCASCHRPDGAGSRDGYYPSLFHNSATGASQPDNLIATLLSGVDRPGGERATFMPGFGHGSYVETLDDGEIASLSNYVLKSFGNPALRVSLADVATIRAGGPTPLLVKLGRLVLPAAVLFALCVLGVLVWLVRRRRRGRAAEIRSH